jgi:hypothetical protein
MYHQTADREVVEESVDVARARSRDAVDRTPPGEVALAPHHDLGVVDAEARRQRTLEDADARFQDPLGVSRHVEPFGTQLIRHSIDGSRRGRQDHTTTVLRPTPYVRGNPCRVTLDNRR